MMITSRALCLLAAVLILPYAASAQDPHAGERPFSFINNDYDARTVALGGASIALPNDLVGTFTNPAAAGFISGRQALCGVRSIIDDVFGGPLGFVMPFSTFGSFGINLVTLSYGTIKQVDNIADRPVYTDITWNAYSVAGQISWSKIVWEQLALGVAVRGFYEREAGSSAEGYSWNAACVQAGLQYRQHDSRLIMGLVLSNAGFMVSSQVRDLKLPLTLTAGFSYVPLYVPNLRLALDLQRTADAFLMYKPGIELALYKKYFFGRAGYRFSERDLEELIKEAKGESNAGYQKSTWYGPSLGIGIVTDVNRLDLNIDAAIQFLDNAAPALCLSVLVKY
jgi:hypothetical protein